MSIGKQIREEYRLLTDSLDAREDEYYKRAQEGTLQWADYYRLINEIGDERMEVMRAMRASLARASDWSE